MKRQSVYLLFVLMLAFSVSLGLGFSEPLYFYLAVVILVIGVPVILTSTRTKRLSFGLLVGGFGFLYNAGPVMGTVTGQLDRAYFTRHILILIVSVIAMAAFFFGYSIPFREPGRLRDGGYASPEQTTSPRIHRNVLIKLILIAVFAVSLFFKVYALWKIGFQSFIVNGRAASQKALAENQSTAGLLGILVYFVIIVTLELYMESRERGKGDKGYLLMFLVSFGLVSFLALVEIDRSNLLKAILPVVLILNYHGKLKTRHIIIGAIALLLLFVIWKQLFQSFIWAHKKIDFGSLRWRMPSEVFAWFKIGSLLQDELAAGHLKYQNGYTYLRALESIVNPIFQDYEPLSRWYVRVYFPDIYNAGGGSGFSCVVESFLNFGAWGSILVFFPMGAFYKFVESRIRGSFYYRCFYFISTMYVFQIFRSEVYSIVKFSFWAGVVPLFGLWLIEKRLKTAVVK